MFEILNGLTWDIFWEYVVDQVKNNEFFATAGFFSVLGLIWAYTKSGPMWLWTRIERRITYSAQVYQTDTFYQYLEKWLQDHREVSYRNVEVELKRPHRGDEEVSMKQFEDVFFMRRGLIWMRVFKGREKMENATDLRNAYLNRFQISGIFAKRAINKFFKEVLEYNIKIKGEEAKPMITIMTNDSSYWQENEDVYPKDLSSMIIEGLDELLKDMRSFLADREWYKIRNIAYKRGYMFYGAPGNGKTTLCMALAKEFKRDIYMLTPHKDMDDSDLISLFRNLSRNSILVLEDVDAIYGTGRKSDEVDFSFSTLLNCLDGALSKEDVIIIFTTNHPENLDPALVREGRIDYKLEVGNPTKRGIERYLEIFYNMDTVILKDFDKNDFISMVEVQNICLRNKKDAAKAVEEISKRIN